jgi:hypothetical protein
MIAGDDAVLNKTHIKKCGSTTAKDNSVLP